MTALAHLWRITIRLVVRVREYALIEPLCALLRLPLFNVIAIIAGRPTVNTKTRLIIGAATVWDKIEHGAHPTGPGLLGPPRL